MIEIKFTEDIKQKYNNNERIEIFDDDNINLFITKDRKKIYSKRQGNKKIGSYLFSVLDIEKLNSGEPFLFYDGKTKVYLKKDYDGDL